MAKKQTSRPAPSSDGEFVSVINLKGSVSLKEWLSGISKKTHIPAAAIVRLGLGEWAKKHGHEAPPEK